MTIIIKHTYVNLTHLQLLRNWLVANREYVENHINMDEYVQIHTGTDMEDNLDVEEACDLRPDDRHHCGTTMCLAGFAATSGVYELRPRDEHDCWTGYIGKVFFGIKYASATHEGYNFLFHHSWPSTYHAALARIDCVLSTGRIPPIKEWRDYGWEW